VHQNGRNPSALTIESYKYKPFSETAGEKTGKVATMARPASKKSRTGGSSDVDLKIRTSI
jgi:hypothetical protein